MILTDFTLLGTTVPEPRRDGRVFVCSAGYSAELRQLVRIYPLSRLGPPHRWHTYKVPLTRNPKDSRRESWQIDGERDPETHPYINQAFVEVGKMAKSQRCDQLGSVLVDSIAEANRQRLSLAIIEPKSAPVLHFEHNPESADSPELRLFDHLHAPARDGARRFAFMPRLRFEDSAGGHDLMLRDWGSYEFLRKFGDAHRQELAGRLHLDDTVSLLVGNLANQRNAWLVISVLRGLRAQAQPSLFDAA